MKVTASFVAIDVETANPRRTSICQIGIARFEDGELVEEWSTFVDPEEAFSESHSSMHGIDAVTVNGQPTFPQIFEKLSFYLSGSITVSYTSFDKIALERTALKYGLSPVRTKWLDSAAVVRRTWTDLAWRGYGLQAVCARIGYDFAHHHALEDAKAAGFVLLACLEKSNTPLTTWLEKVDVPINTGKPIKTTSVKRNGNPAGPLHGQVIVFTGELGMPKEDAADMAASLGCDVKSSVTRKTTILVIGTFDLTQLAGKSKSSKCCRAEQLNSEGQHIKIVQASEFQDFVARASQPVANQPVRAREKLTPTLNAATKPD